MVRTLRFVAFLFMAVWLYQCSIDRTKPLTVVEVVRGGDTLGIWAIKKQNIIDTNYVKTNGVIFEGVKLHNLPKNVYIYDTLTFILE